MHRPAAAGGVRRRRPAAAGVPKAVPKRRAGGPPADGRPAAERFENGEEIASEEVKVEWLTPGVWLQSQHGVYGGEKAIFAGRVLRVVVEGAQVEAELELTGTKLESLLRYATGQAPAVVRVHLCPNSCDQLRANPNLLHAKYLQKLSAATPKTWEENLVVADELHPLRAHQEAWKAGKDREEVESKSSTAKGKKKKKKKDDKGDGKESKKKKKKKKKVGGRAIAKKKLEDVYSGTGLDPNPKTRRSLLKKTRKRLRKSKSSSSDSSSSTSTSSSLVDGQMPLLEDKSRIQKIAYYAPGMLTQQAVASMKDNINTAGGTPWSVDEESIPPICLQYTRQFLVAKATQGMSRELLTLAHVLDCLLQGRCAEAADLACQRLKALEMVQQGQPWATAAKLELVGPAEPTVSSRPEIQIAAKEAQLDAKAKGSSWSSSEKGKAKGKGKDKGKDKDKGKSGGKGDAEKQQAS